MFNQECAIRIEALEKELSDIKLAANDITISQKAVKNSHLTEQSLRKRVAAKRKDLMLGLIDILHVVANRQGGGYELSFKLYATLLSYQFFKKTIPLEIKNDPFEKSLIKLTERLFHTESARNNKLKFKWK